MTAIDAQIVAPQSASGEGIGYPGRHLRLRDHLNSFPRADEVAELTVTIIEERDESSRCHRHPLQADKVHIRQRITLVLLAEQFPRDASTSVRSLSCVS